MPPLEDSSIAPCGHPIDHHVRGANDCLWCYDCRRGLLACKHAPQLLREYFKPGPKGDIVDNRFVLELLNILDKWEQAHRERGIESAAFIDSSIRLSYMEQLDKAIAEDFGIMNKDEITASKRCAEAMLAARRDVARKTSIEPPATREGYEESDAMDLDTIHLRPTLPGKTQHPTAALKLDRSDSKAEDNVSSPDQWLHETTSGHRALAMPHKRKRSFDAEPQENRRRASHTSGRTGSFNPRPVSYSPRSSFHTAGSAVYEDDHPSAYSESSDDSLVEKPSKKIDRAFESVPTAKLIAIYTEMARDHRKQAINVLREACRRDGILADWIMGRLAKPPQPWASGSYSYKRRLIEETEPETETAEEMLEKFTQPAKPTLRKEYGETPDSSTPASYSKPDHHEAYHEKFVPWPAGATGQCKYHPGILVWESTLAEPSAWNEPSMDAITLKRIKTHPDMYAWTCCKRSGAGEGCKTGHHPIRPDASGSARRGLHHREMAVRSRISSDEDPPPETSGAASISPPPLRRDSQASDFKAPPAKMKPSRQQSSSEPGKLTTAAFLAKFHAGDEEWERANRNSGGAAPTAPSHDPNSELKLKDILPPRFREDKQPESSKRDQRANISTPPPGPKQRTTWNSSQTGSGVPASTSAAVPDTLWSEFPPYAQGRDGRHQMARNIVARAHIRYAPEEGCTKCRRKQWDCLWSPEREKCAYCCAHNVSRDHCTMGWERGKGEAKSANPVLLAALNRRKSSMKSEGASVNGGR